jgi:putative ABC transport system substrate-binding protein
MRRREFIALLTGLAAWEASAQQPASIALIGALFALKEDEEAKRAFSHQEELGNLGWIEGRNVRIEHRWAGSDQGRGCCPFIL